MKPFIISCLMIAAAIGWAPHAVALDTSVSNDFWCTWGYVNPSPNTRAAVAETEVDSYVGSCQKGTAGDVDTRLGNRVDVVLAKTFSSTPAGVCIIVR